MASNVAYIVEGRDNMYRVCARCAKSQPHCVMVQTSIGSGTDNPLMVAEVTEFCDVCAYTNKRVTIDIHGTICTDGTIVSA